MYACWSPCRQARRASAGTGAPRLGGEGERDRQTDRETCGEIVGADGEGEGGRMGLESERGEGEGGLGARDEGGYLGLIWI